MNMPVLTLLVGLGTFNQIQAQESLSNKADIRIDKGKKGAERLTFPAPKQISVEKKSITYTGFWGDLFSNRKKVDLLEEATVKKTKKDKDNVYTDPATDKPKGFVFFAIRF